MSCSLPVLFFFSPLVYMLTNSLPDMVKNTEPTHNDYTSLVHAHESMRKFSMEVNEAKRKEESMTQMFHIQKLIAKTPVRLFGFFQLLS